jgi:hypothetical protein
MNRLMTGGPEKCRQVKLFLLVHPKILLDFEFVFNISNYMLDSSFAWKLGRFVFILTMKVYYEVQR